MFGHVVLILGLCEGFRCVMKAFLVILAPLPNTASSDHGRYSARSCHC